MHRPHTLLVAPQPGEVPPLNGLHGRIDQLTYNELSLLSGLNGYHTVALVDVPEDAEVLEHLQQLQVWQRTEYLLALRNRLVRIYVHNQRLQLLEAIKRANTLRPHVHRQIELPYDSDELQLVLRGK